jgi:predicted DCC family thiol-disulfide oxidoreductase YuxK
MGTDRAVAIVFFDGECNLCNTSVNFIIHWDTRNFFQFSPLQSAFAHQRLPQELVASGLQNTIVLKINERIYSRSDAALEIARNLSGIWPVFYFFKIVPKFIRDFIYDFIASHRYKWFGKSSCLLPSADLKARFLE